MIRAEHAVFAIAAALAIFACDAIAGAADSGSRFSPSTSRQGAKVGLPPQRIGEDPALRKPAIELPTLDDFLDPKKIRCRAVKNRRSGYRLVGPECGDLLPPRRLPEIRLADEECLVEIDRLGNRYLIGDECPDDPIELPENDPGGADDPDLPELDCFVLVERVIGGIPVWVPSEDGCDEAKVDLPAPEIPEDFGHRCPDDFFSPSEYTDETKFAMPVHAEYGPLFPHPILAEPFVIHRDHDEATGANKADCETYDGWHLCYDGHTGTDFMLAGHFLAMDNANVYARAAATGRVMRVVDGNFDRCQVDLDPTSTTFMEIICPDPETGETTISGANHVDICHPDGTVTQYYHLMEGSIEVVEGQLVSCGEPLAKLGSSGVSSAPHLHFEVRKIGEDGVRRDVDPYAVNDADSLWVDQNGGLPGTLPGTDCQ